MHYTFCKFFLSPRTWLFASTAMPHFYSHPVSPINKSMYICIYSKFLVTRSSNDYHRKYHCKMQKLYKCIVKKLNVTISPDSSLSRLRLCIIKIILETKWKKSTIRLRRFILKRAKISSVNAVSWTIPLSCLLDFQVPPFPYPGCLRSLLCAALSDLSPLQQITRKRQCRESGDCTMCIWDTKRFLYSWSYRVLHILLNNIKLFINIWNWSVAISSKYYNRIMYYYVQCIIMRKTLVFIYIYIYMYWDSLRVQREREISFFFFFISRICRISQELAHSPLTTDICKLRRDYSDIVSKLGT